jgi:hypothetical protein
VLVVFFLEFLDQLSKIDKLLDSDVCGLVSLKLAIKDDFVIIVS